MRGALNDLSTTRFSLSGSFFIYNEEGCGNADQSTRQSACQGSARGGEHLRDGRKPRLPSRYPAAQNRDIEPHADEGDDGDAAAAADRQHAAASRDRPAAPEVAYVEDDVRRAPGSLLQNVRRYFRRTVRRD